MQEEGSLKTRSLHADIIVNLSGSKHIAAALSTFGVTGGTNDLLVAKINASGEIFELSMSKYVLIPFACTSTAR